MAPRSTPRNDPPGNKPPAGAPAEAVRKYFARKITALMAEKGIRKQSELARRLTEVSGYEISRSAVNTWVRGKNIATDAHLSALCTYFKVNASDLLPNLGNAEVNTETDRITIQSLPDNRVWLRVNQAVTMSQATAIMNIINDVGA